MKTIDEVLSASSDPLAAADELVRRFSSDDSERREAALRWMHWAAARGGATPLGRDTPFGYEAERMLRHVHMLVEQATVGVEPLHEWATRARRKEPGRREERVVYEVGLLNLLVWMWSVRENKAHWLERVEAWGRVVAQPCETSAANGRPCACGGLQALRAALPLADYPDLAYRVIAPAMTDPRLAADDLVVLLALHRSERSGPLDDRDHQALQAFGVRRILREPLALRALVGVVREGRRDLSWLWPEVEAALADPSEWPGAITVLCASHLHQDRAVALLAGAVRLSANPAEPLERVVSGDLRALIGLEPFGGPGWGRERLARRVVPLTRALIARGIWPIDILKRYLPAHGDDDREQQAFERMRDMLAEACLAIALDEEEAVASRERGLAALERLAPPDRTLALALSKLKGAPLWERARRAQRAIERRDGVDAELALIDAMELLGVNPVHTARRS